MAVCRFYIQGNCKFGDKCWNEHPRQGGGYQEQRGDYLLSANQRSLVRNTVAPNFSFTRSLSEAKRGHNPSAANFSFTAARNNIETRNRFGTLQEADYRSQRNEYSRSPLGRWKDAEMQDEQQYSHTKQSRWNEPAGQALGIQSSARSFVQPSLQRPSGFGSEQPFGQSQTHSRANAFSFRQALAQTKFAPPTAFPMQQETHPTSELTKTDSRSPMQSSFVSKGTTTDPSTYTALSDLTEKEKEQFLTQIFNLGKIPILPPPHELCF